MQPASDYDAEHSLTRGAHESHARAAHEEIPSIVLPEYGALSTQPEPFSTP